MQFGLNVMKMNSLPGLEIAISQAPVIALLKFCMQDVAEAELEWKS